MGVQIGWRVCVWSVWLVLLSVEVPSGGLVLSRTEQQKMMKTSKEQKLDR